MSVGWLNYHRRCILLIAMACPCVSLGGPSCAPGVESLCIDSVTHYGRVSHTLVGEPDTGVDGGAGTVPLSERDPAPKPETKPGPVVKPAVDTVKATVVKIVVTYLSSIRLMRQPLRGFPMPATVNGSLCPWCLHCWGALLIAAKAWA